MTTITITNLTKRFGSTAAVNSVSLTIPTGSLFFLLGPSGCGKTTLLRMLAGFIEPTAGSIRFNDVEISTLPPNKRDTGMVFQSYALWPHMTVEQNVAYGLDVRKVSRDEKQARVRQALESVHLAHLADRRPNQLSGGQQQRVALARALVVKPRVLLLDEPLSNLDAKLRLEMRGEIRRICKQTGITTVYVTHDQKEALSIADHMAVLDQGRIIQAGPPFDLYTRPHNRFIADFLGETNFVSGRIARSEAASSPSLDAGGKGVGDVSGTQAFVIETPFGLLRGTLVGGGSLNAGGPTLRNGSSSPPTAHNPQPAVASPPPTGNVTCSIRPEAIRIADGRTHDPADNLLSAAYASTTYLGEVARHAFTLSDGSTLFMLAQNPRSPSLANGRVTLAINPADVVLLAD